YGYKFVPFTGIDHNQRCVTFGATFLKTHKKQPPFAVTDQDGALRKGVVKMFPDSHHRLLEADIQEKDKNKAKNGQNRARNGKV
ncbi:hypothetical protein Tco_0191906, partial [Tanacetum coccineum]